MTEKEKKAIKTIEEFRDYYAREDIHKENFNNNQSYEKALSEIRQLRNNFDKVLNLIIKLQKENEELNNRCRNLDKEAQAYLEKLAGDNTLTRRTIKQLQEENEELNEKILDNSGIYQLGFKDGEESYIKKVKDKIRKNEEIIDISNDGYLIHELLQKNKVYEELLESEE